MTMALYLHKVQQISESHCGPAVLQMLLGVIGIDTTQEAIEKAGEAEGKLEDYGMRIDQLVLASARLAPQMVFWYKQETSLEDIDFIHKNGYVVGVEWQSLFYDHESQETPGKDYGHFSILYKINWEKQVIIMSDPYKDYIDNDREFTFEFFLRRWWDTNDIRDPQTGETVEIKDTKAAFLVLPPGEDFPKEVGFLPFTSSEFNEDQDFNLLSPSRKLQLIRGLLKGRVRRLG